MEKEYKIIHGNCIDTLKTLPDKSVQCCITSPPYYGLRDYGTGKWVGGDPNCPHRRLSKYSPNDITGNKAMGEHGEAVGDAIYKSVCPLCGAVRVDEQIGLEETPEEYISRLVDVFREVKRVLKDDGTLWVNIGDSYNDYKGNAYSEYADSKFVGGDKTHPTRESKHGLEDKSLKPKDLIGIPWMLAFALRNDGWYLRQDIIWLKPNPMPESVKDRCTKSHEYIFLLSKSQTYYFDCGAIQEPASGYDGRNDTMHKGSPKYAGKEIMPGMNEQFLASGSHERWKFVDGIPIRNKRDVWSVNVSGYSEAHFATFPTKLVEPCVLAGTKQGDTVLDPFSGSGTTGVVSMNYGRKYIGCELNEEYIKLSEDRFSKEVYHEDKIVVDGEKTTVTKEELF